MTEVEQLSEMIRTLYYMARSAWEQKRFGKVMTHASRNYPQWDGGYDERNDRVCQPVWPDLARVFMTNHLDPGLAVRAVFDNWVQAQPPMPTYFKSAEMLDMYRKLRASVAQDLKFALESQSQVFHTRVTVTHKLEGISLDIAADRALRDESLGLSYLFRYSIALQTGRTEMAERILPAALFQYIFTRREYDREWGSFIPQALRDKTREVMGDA